MKKISTILLLCVIVGIMACERYKPDKQVLQEVDGSILRMQDLKGKWVIINYWASWCHPCVDEIPELNAFYQQNKDKNVVVIGVNYDNVETAQLKRIIAQAKISYPNLIDDPRLVLGLGDIPGLPATYIFSPDGKLKDKLFGQQTKESLQQAIQRG